MRLLLFAGFVPYWWAQQLLRAFITDFDSESVSFSEREDTWDAKLKAGRQHHILFLLELLTFILLFQCLDIKENEEVIKYKTAPREVPKSTTQHLMTTD